MADIGALTREKPRDVTIDLGDGDTVQVTFDMNKVTPAWVAEAERRDSELDALSLPKALEQVMVRWDVTKDGEPFPPTATNMAVLSYPAQSMLLQAVMQAAVPSDAEGKALSVPTETPSTGSTPQSQTSLNGPTVSPSPAPSASLSPT